MTAKELTSVAKAEKILNRTLAYQAAIAVHELKDQLDLDVAELRLVVAPESSDAPGCYRVTCTIETLATPRRLTLKVKVMPEQAIAPVGPKAGRKHANPSSRGRARRTSG
jgi:hypothetical protein